MEEKQRNKYLAEKLEVNHKTVSSWISDLRDKNYIKVEMVRKENKLWRVCM